MNQNVCAGANLVSKLKQNVETGSGNAPQNLDKIFQCSIKLTYFLKNPGHIITMSLTDGLTHSLTCLLELADLILIGYFVKR